MKKTVLKYGLISGVIIAGMILASIAFLQESNFVVGAVVGYSTMLITFSTVFYLGTKSYRDKYLGGTISFWKAFLFCIYVALIGSFMYALAWEISLAVRGMKGTDFMAQWVQAEAAKMEKAGMSAEIIAKKTQEQMAGYAWYDNMFKRFLWTMFAECFEVGVVVAVFVSLIMRKKKPQPAYA